jgi:intraflagellar transport protein 88
LFYFEALVYLDIQFYKFLILRNYLIIFFFYTLFNFLKDTLREDIKEKKREAIKIIVDCSKLIAPVIEDDIILGYDWILDTLKNSYFPEVESEVEICKAMAYLKKKEMEKSIEVLRNFERKDKIMMARVATNISFLYFLENDHKNAEKYAEIAINYDRYNAKVKKFI